LTQHRSKLDCDNTRLLNELGKKYKLVMMAAGSCERVYKQMNQYPIDIVGNYGLQRSTISNEKMVIVKNESYDVDIDHIKSRINDIRINTGYIDYLGDSVEFHKSGLITFPLLGTEANIEDKLAFDPKGLKRSAIYDYVAEVFSEYNCFIGGSSSFDISQKKYNKYNALLDYCNDIGVSINNVLFVGDDFKKGGNDEPIKINGVHHIVVTDYKQLRLQLEHEGLL